MSKRKSPKKTKAGERQAELEQYERWWLKTFYLRGVLREAREHLEKTVRAVVREELEDLLEQIRDLR